MTAFPSYSTGTVAIGAGATSIVGTGSNWTGQNAVPGDTFTVPGKGSTKIVDVTSATALVIDAWPFGAITASAYNIKKDSPLRFAGGQAMADVSTLVGALNTDGFYVFVPSTATVPDPSYGNDGQFAFQATTGKLWQKAGGVWNFLGINKGFGLPAPWSAATAYNTFDVATIAGTSYVCILANTNQTPPNATYWSVLAGVGATGSTGLTGPGYGGTSTTSFAIGTGLKAFTTQAGLAYQVGTYVRAASTAGGANFMEGPVTAYSGTTLTINVTKIGGSGTLASWSFSVSGAPGTGDLLSTNNLSELTNKTTAIDILSVKGADIASAATLNLDSATGNFVHVTGTTTITAITLTTGRQRTVYFAGTLTLTNGASLVLPGGANITTAAGDTAVFVADGTVVRCTDYSPAGPLSTQLGGTGGTGGTWATWTPTVTATVGAFTTVSATGGFYVIGKLVHFSITVTISNVGSASQAIVIPLPVGTAARNATATASEVAVSGQVGWGRILSGGNTISQVLTYNNGSYIANGAQVVVTGIYEQA